MEVRSFNSPSDAAHALATTAAVGTLRRHALVKQAAPGGEAISEGFGKLLDWWKSLPPGLQGSLIGAGGGGLFGLLSSLGRDEEDRNIPGSMLTGAVGGGLLGGGIGMGIKYWPVIQELIDSFSGKKLPRHSTFYNDKGSLKIGPGTGKPSVSTGGGGAPEEKGLLARSWDIASDAATGAWDSTKDQIGKMIGDVDLVDMFTDKMPDHNPEATAAVEKAEAKAEAKGGAPVALSQRVQAIGDMEAAMGEDYESKLKGSRYTDITPGKLVAGAGAAAGTAVVQHQLGKSVPAGLTDYKRGLLIKITEQEKALGKIPELDAAGKPTGKLRPAPDTPQLKELRRQFTTPGEAAKSAPRHPSGVKVDVGAGKVRSRVPFTGWAGGKNLNRGAGGIMAIGRAARPAVSSGLVGKVVGKGRRWGLPLVAAAIPTIADKWLREDSKKQLGSASGIENLSLPGGQ